MLRGATDAAGIRHAHRARRQVDLASFAHAIGPRRGHAARSAVSWRAKIVWRALPRCDRWVCAIEQPSATRLLVHGVGLRGLKAAAHALDMGNAGTAIRLFTGLLAAQRFDSQLIGDESLMQRPMERVAQAAARDGRARCARETARRRSISAAARRLHGIEYPMPVASAQVKSAILLAGLYADGATTVVSPAVSRDHSERMLEGCGVRIVSRGLDDHDPSARAAREPQARGARRLLLRRIFHRRRAARGAAGGVGAAKRGFEPHAHRAPRYPAQHGRQIFAVENPRLTGAEPVGDLRVHRSALTGVHVPASLVPLAIDEFPVLFIAAACAQGETVVSGAEELRVKESDRIAAMGAGLSAWASSTASCPTACASKGGPRARLSAAERSTAAAIIGSRWPSAWRACAPPQPIAVRDAANVATSFPGFVGLARSVGLDLADGVGSA